LKLVIGYGIGILFGWWVVDRLVYWLWYWYIGFGICILALVLVYWLILVGWWVLVVDLLVG
jgi:hypothetical protein